MPFLRANIDRAIVMTQYDLRGFAHPLGVRLPRNASGKNLDATTCNLVSFAAGCCGADGPTVACVSPFQSTYEEYLDMCKRLHEDCELSEREAIQLIVRDIVSQSEEMKAEVTAGKRKPDSYLQPLSKESRWGMVVLALAEAFEVNFEQAIVA